MRQGPSLEENFRDCLFRVVPKQDFQARTALRKAERQEQELVELVTQDKNEAKPRGHGSSMIKTKQRRRTSVVITGARKVRETFTGSESEHLSEEEIHKQNLEKARNKCEELRMRVAREKQRNEQNSKHSRPIQFTANTVQLQVGSAPFLVHA